MDVFPLWRRRLACSESRPCTGFIPFFTSAARGPPGGTASGAASTATDSPRFPVIRLLWIGLERSVIIVADLPEWELGQLDIRLNIAVTRAMAFVRFVEMNDALRVVVS